MSPPGRPKGEYRSAQHEGTPMSTPQLVSLASAAPQAWRNGGGLTREFMAWPSAADWQLRLSVAQVERDGPFSAFPGVQRWFCVLEGAGVELDFNGSTQCVRMGDPPMVFDGAAAPGCRLLDGPTHDLNLMLQGAALGSGAGGGGLVPVQAGEIWQPNGGVCGLFTAACAVCHEGDARAWVLQPYSLLWWGEPRSDLRLRCERTRTEPLADLTAPSPLLAAPLGWWVQGPARA